MRRLAGLLALLLLSAVLVGCGSDKDRGKERNQDKPQAGDTKDK